MFVKGYGQFRYVNFGNMSQLFATYSFTISKFRQISMGSSHSNSSNSLQDPAVISYTKKTKNSKEEFMDTEGPIETLDKNDSIIEI